MFLVLFDIDFHKARKWCLLLMHAGHSPVDSTWSWSNLVVRTLPSSVRVVCPTARIHLFRTPVLIDKLAAGPALGAHFKTRLCICANFEVYVRNHTKTVFVQIFAPDKYNNCTPNKQFIHPAPARGPSRFCPHRKGRRPSPPIQGGGGLA